jgi:chorismate-pyruvate lyase
VISNENEIGEVTHDTEKQITNLFIAQYEKPADLEEIDLSRLTPLHRALLVTDGTVTRFLEAYTLSPVNVVLLTQETQTLSTDHVWLETEKGTAVIRRQVSLQTEQNVGQPPTIHTYATSLIVLNRTPTIIEQGLKLKSDGLGELLKRSGLETRRDLLWCGFERPKDLPEHLAHLREKPFLTRTYRIVADEQPIMLINERFPLSESTPTKSSDSKQV